jgi:hypothetical protein
VEREDPNLRSERSGNNRYLREQPVTELALTLRASSGGAKLVLEGTTITSLEIPLARKSHRPWPRVNTGQIWPGEEWIFNGNWFREVV